MASVYEINKGVNRSVVFRGIKAQYIIYLALSLVILLLLFAILFIAGVNSYICLGIILPLGSILFIIIKHLSNKFGQYGLMKKAAQRQLPNAIQSRSRKTFIQLSNKEHEED
jgi:hypothetical protein